MNKVLSLITLNLILCLFLMSRCDLKRNEISSQQKQKIDSIFSDWTGERPGGAFAVVKNQKVIYENYFGLANIDKKETFNPQTIIDIGSVSKQFTAACIAILEERNELNLQNDIRKYIPELPIYQDTIKVTHLIHHTSGIKDYEALVNLTNRHYFEDFMTNQFVLELASKQKSLNFQPGCQYEYSNTNYILLAEIVERISGQSLNEFATEHIFKPLGMKSSFFNQSQGGDFKNKAYGYVPSKEGFETPMYRAHIVGDGGVFTTLEDMIKWDRNFSDNQLGLHRPELTERMKSIEPFCDGRVGYYAFAQQYTKLPYGNSWSHGGGGGGYRTFYERFEEEQMSFIVLSNSDNSNAFGKSVRVSRIFLAKPKNSTPKNKKQSKTEVEQVYLKAEEALIKSFEAYYYDSINVSVLKVEFDRSAELFNVVTVDEWKDIFPTSATTATTLVQTQNGRNQFILENGNTLLHKSNGRLRGEFIKLTPSTKGLTEFIGTYFSEEVSHEIKLSVENNRLHAPNNYFNNLVRISENLFVDSDSGATLNFVKGSQGGVSSFSISIRNGDRLARNIEFKKVSK